MSLRPGPQPHNAGLDPKYARLATRKDDHLPATKGDLRLVARQLRRLMHRKLKAEARVTGEILAKLLAKDGALAGEEGR